MVLIPAGEFEMGMDADQIPELLQTISLSARNLAGTEYLTTYVIDNQEQFRTTKAIVNPSHARDWRLTLDTPEDLEVINTLLTALHDKGKGLDYRLDDIVEFIESNPDILRINANIRQCQTPAEVDVSLNWLDIR